jgi:hypothetical protein
MIQEIHIGKILRNVLHERNMTINRFATLMKKGNTAVNRWFILADINTEILKQAGEVLDYNFFKHYVTPEEITNVVKEAEANYHSNKGITPAVKQQLETLQETNKTQQKTIIELQQKLINCLELKN